MAGGSERFDAVVSTLPIPLLARVARGALADAMPLSDLALPGLSSTRSWSRARRLERFYWTIVVDPALPVPGRRRDDARHPARVGRRAPSHLPDELLRARVASRTSAPTTSWRGQAVEGLATLYPRFRRQDVEAVYVFRAPHVEPAWTRRLSRPASGPASGSQPRSISCTTAQAYPRVTAWNTSVALARETATAVLTDLGRSAAAAG